MKCGKCVQPATHHIGTVVEEHLCKLHAEELLGVDPYAHDKEERTVFREFWEDAAIAQAMGDPAGQRQFSAHLLPVLCLALLDNNPAVRVRATFRLMLLGRDAQSAAGALHDALRDADQRVCKAARLALEHIETNPEPNYVF